MLVGLLLAVALLVLFGHAEDVEAALFEGHFGLLVGVGGDVEAEFGFGVAVSRY